MSTWHKSESMCCSPSVKTQKWLTLAETVSENKKTISQQRWKTKKRKISNYRFLLYKHGFCKAEAKESLKKHFDIHSLPVNIVLTALLNTLILFLTEQTYQGFYRGLDLSENPSLICKVSKG